MGGRRRAASRQLDVPRSISVRPDHHRTSVSRRGHCHSSGHRFGAHLDSLESAAWSEIRFPVAVSRGSDPVTFHRRPRRFASPLSTAPRCLPIPPPFPPFFIPLSICFAPPHLPII